jgi:hypothetical protein
MGLRITLDNLSQDEKKFYKRKELPRKAGDELK